MGLDMRPMGKPKPGFEKRYNQIFQILQGTEEQKLDFWDRLKGKKILSKDELLKEWFENQIPSYVTIKAPQVGKDPEADEWIKSKYEETDKSMSTDDFIKYHEGYFVVELAKETDGLPAYISFGNDLNVFRGQFLHNCRDLIGDDLLNEAWATKLGDETLDYGQRLLKQAERIATEKGLLYLKEQRKPPESDEESLEFKLHIVFSLAKWLIFYGKNGHGYEADY